MLIRNNKNESRSTSKDGPNDLAGIIARWSKILKQGKVPHARAVAGLTTFEYGICMGSNHLLSEGNRKMMREHEYLLKYGLDTKTKLIHRFYRIFGYDLPVLRYVFICGRAGFGKSMFGIGRKG